MAAAVVRPSHADIVLGLLLSDPGKVLGALKQKRAAVREHVVGVKLADGLDVGRDETVVDVLNERI
eukprot:1525235-Pleurochrysis_carterae.AAC.1